MGLRIFNIGLLLFSTFHAYAFAWWETPDQKAYKAFQKKQYQEAMSLFKRPDWRGVAAFRQKNYIEAIRSFAENKSPDGFYNLGTALAFQGDYENAIKAYHKVLSLEPNHQDAKFNLAILEKMKQDKKNQQSKQEQQEKGKQQSSKNKQQNPNEHPDYNKQEQSSKKQKIQGKEKKESSMPIQKQKTQEEQWLKLIEDDPAGLLKQKFLRDYQRAVEEGKA